MLKSLDSRLRGNDKKRTETTFYEAIENQRLIDNRTQLIYQLNRVCYQGAFVVTIFFGIH